MLADKALSNAAYLSWRVLYHLARLSDNPTIWLGETQYLLARHSIHTCRISALRHLETGQRKCNAPCQRIRGVVCRLRPRRYMGELRRTPHSQRSLCCSHERSSTGRLRCCGKLCLRGSGIPIEVFYAIVDLSIGIFIIGFVMLKERGIFNRTTAYLGLTAAIFGFISVGDLL